MKQLWSIAAVALPALALAAACSGPPPQSGASGQSGGAGRPTQTSQAAQTTATQAAAVQSVQYDPDKDPLVNPKSLFEPYPKDHPELVQPNSTLVLHLDGNPNSLNPVFSSSIEDNQVGNLLYTGLFTADQKLNWEVNKDVVASFEDAPDHLSSTVKIKPGLKWQDGQPWTAEDVAFSYQMIMDPKVPAVAMRGSGVDQLKNVVAVDPQTVRFEYKEPQVANKWNISYTVVPKHIFDNADERAKDPTMQQSDYFNRYNRNSVVGSGPYRLISWKDNDQLVLEAWDGYVGDRPCFKRIICKIEPDANTTMLSFKDGALDVVENLTSKQFATTNDKQFAEHGFKAKGTEWTYSYIGWNLRDTKEYPCPFFVDKNVRVALAEAMNVPEIIAKVGYNLPTRSYGIAFHDPRNPSADDPYYNPEIEKEAINFDLKKAGDLLDSAGWKLSSDDGWRYKTIDGKPVKFEFELLIPQGADTSDQVAAYYGSNLRQIGISLKTRKLEWAVYQKETNEHKFQACIAAWGTAADPSQDSNLWATDQYDGGRNYGGYSNPRVDELFKQGRTEFDLVKRVKIYQEIAKIIYEDQPYLFLWYRPTLAAINRNLHGIGFSPTGIEGFDPGMNNWWFSAAQARKE